MQNIIKLPRLLLLRPAEYKWINNILNVAKRDAHVKKCLIDGQAYQCLDKVLHKCPKIDKDGHTGYTIAWPLNMAGEILKSESKIRKHKDGFQYMAPWE